MVRCITIKSTRKMHCCLTKTTVLRRLPIATSCSEQLYARHSSTSPLLSHSIYKPPGQEAGAGAPFLITHGLLGSKLNWNSIAKATAKAVNRKIVTFDARNHGDSPSQDDISYELMAEDIQELSRHLEIEKFSLMGHSMGGRTVMAFALKYPDLIEKLVVVDVSPLDLYSDFPTMKVYLQTLYDIGLNLKDSTIPLSEARKIADASLKTVVSEPAVRAFLLTNLAEKDGKIMWKPNLEVLIRNFAEIGKFPKALLNKKFDKSTLFIKGEKSQYIPDSVFPEIQKTFTNAQLNTVQNAGHWPHAENTGRFMEILLPFIRP